ncbi:MAG: NADH-quinone oxidoreductase subunit M [Planctomycetes bacterium]|nr:NADH-quinone oxidoreductase subunit M [Planctomycetota bacterium]
MNSYLYLVLAAPFVAAIFACFTSGRDGDASLRLGILLSLVTAGLALPLITCMGPIEVSRPWFTLWNTDATVQLSLASDGLSAWLIQLVAWLTPVAIIASRDQVGDRMRELVVALLVMQGMMFGALLARDLVVFYLAFEGMLIPVVVLMAVFGGADRRGAALQFFLYTMLGSVFMLVSIWFIANRVHTTGLAEVVAQLGGPDFADRERLLMFLAFALAFAVKVPLFPLHGWQPLTYAECPTGALVLLSGAMAKLGTYGLLRFVLPMFPDLCAHYATWFIVLGLIGAVGGALMALAQTDVKRLLAYSSLSHLGLVVVGIFTFSPLALQGAAVQMVAHGFSVAALFILAGYVEQRAERRGVEELGGLVNVVPRLAVLFVIAALASAALPGTANFAGELLLLLGVFDPSRWWIAALAGVSTILGAVYLLRLIQRWFYGEPRSDVPAMEDLRGYELAAVVPLLLLSVGFGFYPAPISSQAGSVAVTLGAPARDARIAAAAASAATEAIAVASPTGP